MTDKSRYSKIQVHPGKELAEQLSRRGDINSVARRDLTRYYDLLTSALPTLSVEEALLLCDALNGVLLREPGTLWGNIATLEDGGFEKWGVDRAAFLSRLARFSLLEELAVIDAVERAWNAPENSVDLRKRVILVGLVKKGQE
jgi:hypothetical protein